MISLKKIIYKILTDTRRLSYFGMTIPETPFKSGVNYTNAFTTNNVSKTIQGGALQITLQTVDTVGSASRTEQVYGVVIPKNVHKILLHGNIRVSPGTTSNRNYAIAYGLYKQKNNNVYTSPTFQFICSIPTNGSSSSYYSASGHYIITVNEGDFLTAFIYQYTGGDSAASAVAPTSFYGEVIA